MDSSETTTWTFSVGTASEPGRLCLLFVVFFTKEIPFCNRNEFGGHKLDCYFVAE
jgi:hypothetical protein